MIRTRTFSRLSQAAILSLFFLSTSSMVNAGTKVAFTGDQGTNENAKAVLAMIANEGTDLLLLQGDFGYDPGTSSAWENNLTNALGADFPVLSVVGNHDDDEWSAYSNFITQRIDRAGELSCSDNPGIKAHCQFRNIEIVQVAPGINGIEGVSPRDNYDQYINDKFSGSSSKWRICSWHKNMTNLQTGTKSNSTGWNVYHECMNAGAIVAVAHEHAYSRTHLLGNFESQRVVHRNSDMTIKPGQSFMFVSGLGGHSIREQSRGGDWWASIYTATQGATHGALFCDFEQNTAQCYFKAIDGSVPDQFSLRLGNEGEIITSNIDAGNTDAEQNTTPPVVAGFDKSSVPGVFQRTDSNELRWVDYDVNGQLGNVWIDQACADTLGGVDLSGTWEDLVNFAPGIDSITSPCEEQVAQQPPETQSADVGYVFSRTDKNELRWIARNANGNVASVRIDDACASQNGGVKDSGDWFRLIEIAPDFDQIQSPCESENTASENTASENKASENKATSTDDSSGYVFARTDKDEMRWVTQSSSGNLGSIRINKVCAANLGGASVSGDWDQLMSNAPEFDGVDHPCDEQDQSLVVTLKNSSAERGYVFERTDIGEYRWVALNADGIMGNVWIDRECAERMGSASVSGDWIKLSELAPGFDSLPYPSVCM